MFLPWAFSIFHFLNSMRNFVAQGRNPDFEGLEEEGGGEEESRWALLPWAIIYPVNS